MTLERTVMREQIKELIIQRILEGTYKPGERIVELQLVHELGVSQAPVREALRDLEAMRFIDSEPYKGARVRAVSRDELAQSYPVRAVLEELAGQMATPRATVELFSQLDSEVQDMRKAARNKDQHSLLVHDARFHELIVEAAGNTILLDTWSGLRIEAFTLVSVVTSRPGPGGHRHRTCRPGRARSATPAAGRSRDTSRPSGTCSQESTHERHPTRPSLRRRPLPDVTSPAARAPAWPP